MLMYIYEGAEEGPEVLDRAISAVFGFGGLR